MAAKNMDQEWRRAVKGLLRQEMHDKKMTYADLAEALVPWGIQEDERNLRNKLARGAFSATFLIQCLAAMEVKSLALAECVERMRIKITDGS